MAAALSVAGLSGCTEALVSPATYSHSGLAVTVRVADREGQPAGSGPAEAFDKASAVRIVLTRTGTPALDTTFALPPPGATRRLGPLSVPMRGSQDKAALSLQLLRDGSVLFRGEAAEVTLRAGHSAEVEVPLTGVPGGVSVPSSVAPLTSLGDTVRLSGTVVFATGDPMPGLSLTWSAAQPGIVEVSQDGRVLATAEGTAKVVGTFGAFSDTVAVSVAAVVASVAIEPDSAVILVDEALQLRSVMRDARGNVLPNRTVEAWVTSAPGIADVDAAGRVRGVAPGTAVITASFQGKSGTTRVTVRPKPVASVEVRPPAPRVEVNQLVQLEAVLRAADGTVLTGRPVGWSSSNAAVATVDTNGRVRGVSPGQATITASSEGVSGSAAVTVTLHPVASVSVEPDSGSIEVDQVLQLVATLRAADGTVLTGRPVGWSSSNAAVATVDANGRVRGLTPGQALITATSEGVSGSSQITVRPKPVASVEVTPAQATIEVGEQLRLTAILRAADGSVLTGREVSWSSGNAAVATVAANGQVYGISAGEATITARSEGRSGTARVTVVPSTRPGAVNGRVVNALTGLPLAGATASFGDGGTTTTAADGYFSISLLPGTYTATIALAGYITATVPDVTVVVSTTTNIGTVALSPTLREGEGRIVLTWSVPPTRDLDAHLTGPIPGSQNRFHLYFETRGSLNGPPWAALDRDDLVGPGPETITITRAFAGVYRYSVHDHTGRNSLNSTALAATQARVRVYRGDEQIADFTVPNAEGTLWTVFEVNGSTGVITPINRMTYHQNPGNVQRLNQGAAAGQTDAHVIGEAVASHPKR